MTQIIGMALVCAIGFSFLSQVQARNFGTGALGRLDYGVIPGSGPIGDILNVVSYAINEEMCDRIGPNFLELFLKQNCCPPELVKPCHCRSYTDFCELYKNAGPELKPCLSVSVVDVLFDAKGMTDANLHVGKCCNVDTSIDRTKNCGQLGNGLIRNELLNEGLAGDLLHGVEDSTSNLLCTLLEPHLLDVNSLKNDCPSGSLPCTPFHSMDDFCDFLNSSPSNIQDCVMEAVATITVPFIHRNELAACCVGKKRKVSPPSCDTISPCQAPATTTKCKC